MKSAIVASAVLALGLTGAAGAAQGRSSDASAAPPAAVPITLVKGFGANLLMLQAGETFYTVFGQGNCRSATPTRLNFLDPKTKDASAQAGAMVVITAHTTLSPLESIVNHDPGIENECSDSIAFLAEPGHGYRVSHRAAPLGCHLEVTDTTTHAAPSSARTMRGIQCQTLLDPATPKAG
jgi:hypothetical protein